MTDTSATSPWARSCYAIDLDGDHPVIVRATRSRSSVEYAILEANATVPQKLGSSTIVATALPVRESITRWISAPFASARKAERVLPALLDIELPFPVEDCACQFLSRQRIETGGTRTLAVAARHTQVRRTIELSKAAGGDPVIIDMEGVAAWTQSLREHPGTVRDDPTMVRLVVHLGASRASLIIGQGSEYRSSHSLGDDPARDMMRLLRIQFEQSPGEIDWRWAGCGATDPARVQAIQTELETDWPGHHHVHSDSASFMARGIATRAVLPGPYRCNLRRGGLAHPLVARRTNLRSMKAAALYLICALLVCAANLGWRSAATSRESMLDRTLRDVATSAAGFPVAAKGEEALQIVKRARESSDVRAESLAKLFAPSLSQSMQTILRAAASNGLGVTTASFRPGNTDLSGEAPDWANCEAFISSLARVGLRATPSQRDDAGGVVRFLFSIHPDS